MLPVGFPVRLITLAGNRFQATTIEDVDVAADVLNQPLRLQRAGANRHAAASNTQQFCQPLVGDGEAGGHHAIARRQQPARQSRLGRMKMQTGAGARQLTELHLR